MTDITELAQSLSIERIKQIALGGQPTIGERERLAITALYFHKELQICTKAFQTAGLNQLAAEEALEKAQQRIAELESRTVKMPEPFKLAKSSSGLTYYFADDVDTALTAAGIKWEAE